MTDSRSQPPSRPPATPIPLPVTPRAVPAPANVSVPPVARRFGFDLSFGRPAAAAAPSGVPVLGALSAIFGVAALFKAPVVLAPLAFLFGLGALFRRQTGLAAIGGIAGAVALAISPVFWTLVGLAWLGSWLLG